MRRIVVANQKGGVGKTTTATNLAVGLARAGQKTLLIDMDPQANATFAVMGQGDPAVTVYDLLIRNRPLNEVVFATSQPNLDIIGSDIDLAGAEVELISAIGGQSRLRARLQSLPPTAYDFLVIDVPPSLGLLTINSLAAAPEVLIPVSTSVFALKGIVQLENTIAQVQANLDCPDLHIMGVLCTLYDNTNVAADVLEAIRQRFGAVMFETVIPKNVKLEETHSRAESIFTYAPASKGAVAYAQLVQEVIVRGR